MLERKRVSNPGQRGSRTANPFDLILTCEKQVYDQVVEDMSTREQETCQPVHVINVNNLETHKEATLGRSASSHDLCQCVQLMEAWRTGLAAAAGVRGKERAGASCLTPPLLLLSL